MIESLDVLAAAIRAASFVAIFQAAGCALFLALYQADLTITSRLIARLGVIAGVLGAALAALYQCIAAARMGGELSDLLDRSLEALSWGSTGGTATLVRIAGTLVLVASLKGALRNLAWVGLIAVVSSFALTGHTSTHDPVIALKALLCIHIAVVVFWFGGLLPLTAVAKSEPKTNSIVRFSQHATVFVPILAGVGLILAWALLPGLSALRTPYGVSLLLKLFGFVALMGLAALNRQRFVPAMERGESNAALGFIRTVRVEYLLIVIVLVVTATMTTLFSPEGSG